MNQERRFLLCGRVEALSLLVLLFLAMPLKYMFGQAWIVTLVGSVHGLIFIAYAMAGWYMARLQAWSGQRLMACLILASIPFGTFYFERILARRTVRPSTPSPS